MACVSLLRPPILVIMELIHRCMYVLMTLPIRFFNVIVGCFIFFYYLWLSYISYYSIDYGIKEYR